MNSSQRHDEHNWRKMLKAWRKVGNTIRTWWNTEHRKSGQVGRRAGPDPVWLYTAQGYIEYDLVNHGFLYTGASRSFYRTWVMEPVPLISGNYGDQLEEMFWEFGNIIRNLEANVSIISPFCKVDLHRKSLTKCTLFARIKVGIEFKIGKPSLNSFDPKKNLFHKSIKTIELCLPRNICAQAHGSIKAIINPPGDHVIFLWTMNKHTCPINFMSYLRMSCQYTFAMISSLKNCFD